MASKYERICFEKDYCNIQGQPTADQICPGHPLLEAVIDIVLEQNADVMKRGSILIDVNDPSEKPRLLFYIESAFQDGRKISPTEFRVINRTMQFVELDEAGHSRQAGYAPYLDYRPASDAETRAIQDYVKTQSWLMDGVEDRALGYAMQHIVPGHLKALREHRTKMADKTAHAVKQRLTSEIQYWDRRAQELKAKEQAGKGNPRLNSSNAARRADELEERLQHRLAELEQEKAIKARTPVVMGGVLVIPQGLLNRLLGVPNEGELFGADRAAIEKASMDAVMYREYQRGYKPSDVSADKKGYDIESRIPDHMRGEGPCLRFIEVKGRRKGSTTVTVTRNEIITALNKPEEFILAIVEVDGIPCTGEHCSPQTHTIYLRTPFSSEPDQAACSVNYEIPDLIRRGTIEP